MGFNVRRLFKDSNHACTQIPFYGLPSAFSTPRCALNSASVVAQSHIGAVLPVSGRRTKVIPASLHQNEGEIQTIPILSRAHPHRLTICGSQDAREFGRWPFDKLTLHPHGERSRDEQEITHHGSTTGTNQDVLGLEVALMGESRGPFSRRVAPDMRNHWLKGVLMGSARRHLHGGVRICAHLLGDRLRPPHMPGLASPRRQATDEPILGFENAPACA